MRSYWMIVASLSMIGALSIVMAGGQPPPPQFTSDFGIHCNDTLLATGGNQYFSLTPGTTVLLEGEDDGEPTQVEFAVLPKIRWISFEAEGGTMKVKTRVVRERAWINGVLAEVSMNYFAYCPKSGNVYYFGEKVNHYENGQIVDHNGSWLAGKNGAQPGLIVPGHFLLGSRYYHANAPDIAMDRGENVQMGLTVETPAGVFEDCIAVLETTPLEPDEEVLKVYAPGVGLIMDGQLQLIDYQN
ncbi:MAG: hypothetical protein L0Y44_15995 [Phycisphaerales bacterium]|nr:hypothetical protein [Phycisphaerales bacterium]MCI0676051.1 hypothetical protein [Phycisphaerales bacterium]